MPRSGELTPLPRTEQASLIANQWTQKPFDFSANLEVPVFNLVSGQPTDQVV